MRQYLLPVGAFVIGGLFTVVVWTIPSSKTATAQDKPLTPRSQPGTDMNIYSPKLHGLYDGKFRLSCDRTYVVGSLS